MRNILIRLFVVLWFVLSVGGGISTALQLSQGLNPSKEIILAKANEISLANKTPYVESAEPDNHRKYAILNENSSEAMAMNEQNLVQYGNEAVNALRVDAIKSVMGSFVLGCLALAAVLLALQFILLGILNPLKLKTNKG